MITFITKGAASTVWACLNPYVEREAVITSSDTSPLPSGMDTHNCKELIQFTNTLL